jgi:hypothetical protein
MVTRFRSSFACVRALQILVDGDAYNSTVIDACRTESTRPRMAIVSTFMGYRINIIERLKRSQILGLWTLSEIQSRDQFY